MDIILTRRFEQNGSDGSEWAVSSGGEHYLDTVGVTSSNLLSPTICGHGSVGRAQPCQGWGRGFEPVVRSSNVQVPFPDGTCFDKRRDGQVVRQGPAKPSPPVRIRFSPPYADMAQLVEHNLAKVGVAGSSRCPLQIVSPSLEGLFVLSVTRSNELMDEIVSNLRIFSLPQTEALLFSFSVYCLRRLTYDAFRCDCVASPAFDDYLLSLRSRSVYGRFFR